MIGPFDESYRLWKYVAIFTLETLAATELQVSQEDTIKKLSFTYSKDVVSFLQAVIFEST